MSKRITILANDSSGLYGFRGELIAQLCRQAYVSSSTPDNGNLEDLNALGCKVILTPVDRRGSTL